MKLFYGLEDKYEGAKNGIVAIGAFDSLHTGHTHLISNLIKIAQQRNLENYVLTFKIPPYKNQGQKIILEYKDKISLLESMGVNNLILCDFDSILSSLTPEDFTKILETQYKIKSYCEGVDFRFGHNQSGTLESLKKLGYSVFLEETFKFGGKKVSTSEIKKYIRCGEIRKVNELLGREYFINGIVTKGKQLGRTIGFPTMNMVNKVVEYPSCGSYITKTWIEGIEYPSMTFVDASIIESHLIGYQNFDYGFPMKVYFLQKIRDNQSFKNFEELRKQLQKDLGVTKKYFNIQ